MAGLRRSRRGRRCCSGRRTTGRAGSALAIFAARRHHRLSRRLFRPHLRAAIGARPDARPHRRQASGRRLPADAGADGTIQGWALWAAIVILCREILVSGLREFLAELKVSVPVSRVAKWKTDAAARGPRLSDRRAGRRDRAAGHIADRHRAALDRRHPDDLYRLGLPEDWHPPSWWTRAEAPMKLVYFAWVRERVGQHGRGGDLPAGIARLPISCAG